MLCDALANSGDLGDNGGSETGGGCLLLLEVLEDDAGDTNLVEVGLLGDESVNQGGCGRGQIGSGLLKSKSLLELQRLSTLDIGGGL